MVLKTYYDDGHFDCFDTVQLVDSSQFRGSRLTNWSIDFDPEGDGPILLNLYWYDSASDEAGPSGLPVAFRRDGWSFVVADASDREHLLRMTVDDEPVLVRLGDGLSDCGRLYYFANMVDHVLPRASKAVAFLEGMRGNWSDGDADDEIAAVLGMSGDGYRWLLEALNALPEEEDDDDMADDNRF
jgi:hypothetical protein